MRIFKNYLKSESGVAGIEAAFILPVMILIFLSLADVAGLISSHQRVGYANAVIGDLVSQNNTTVASSSFDDYFKAATIIVNPQTTPQIGATKIRISAYRLSDSDLKLVWTKDNGVDNGQNCDTRPSLSQIEPLMAAGNDIIVTQTCTVYKPIFTKFLGYDSPTKNAMTVNTMSYVRPRASLTLTLKQ